jgi:hypothetical protein
MGQLESLRESSIAQPTQKNKKKQKKTKKKSEKKTINKIK